MLNMMQMFPGGSQVLAAFGVLVNVSFFGHENRERGAHMANDRLVQLLRNLSTP